MMTDIHSSGIPCILCKSFWEFFLHSRFSCSCFFLLSLSLIPHLLHCTPWIISSLRNFQSDCRFPYLSAMLPNFHFWKLVSYLSMRRRQYQVSICNIAYRGRGILASITLMWVVSHPLASHKELVSTVWQCLLPILASYWGPSPQCLYLGLASMRNMISDLTHFSLFLLHGDFAFIVEQIWI